MDAPSSGVRPPADPKGPPLVLIKKSIFGRPTLIIFTAPSVPMNTNFERECAPKKTQFFLVKIFQKVPKNGFFDPFFFKILPAGQNTRPKHWFFSALGELRK